MKVIGVIPARYKSSRFPGKPLIHLLGKPMIIWVCEIVEKALGKENTYVATDDNRIKNIVEEFGFKVVMTSENCLTGTDRVAEVSRKIDADIYINIQGDEPLLNPEDILNVLEAKINNPDFITNGMKPLEEDENPENINIPKVLVNNKNELIYMSRLPIPGIKSRKIEKPIYFKQVCIYAFSKNELSLFANENCKAKYEEFEDIEILRFFDLGCKIKMVRTISESYAIDVPDDLLLVESKMKDIILKKDE